MKDDSKETKTAEAVEKKGGKNGWLVIPVLGILSVAAVIFLWPFGNTSTDGDGEDETEQTTPAPAPIIQVEIPASSITGEYAWSNIPADKQALLTETAAPDLNGEKVLLAHKVSGWNPGSTMYWIQTEAADGTSEAPIRNIFTDESHVVVK